MNLPSSCNSSSCASQVQSPNHRGICPAGWHVPSDAEWDTLVRYVDPSFVSNTNNVAGKKLKSTSSLWTYDATHVGTDDYGFSALPGGSRWDDGSFNGVGNSGAWWSATEFGTTLARRRNMYYNYSLVDWDLNYKTSRYSLRCVEDVRP